MSLGLSQDLVKVISAVTNGLHRSLKGKVRGEMRSERAFGNSERTHTFWGTSLSFIERTVVSGISLPAYKGLVSQSLCFRLPVPEGMALLAAETDMEAPGGAGG